MKKIVEKVKTLWGAENDEVEKTEKVTIPILSMILGPFSTLVDKFKAFAVVGFFYAILLTAISFAFGSSYMCMFREQSSFYCTNNMFIYWFHTILRFVLLSMFIVKFYDFGMKNQKLDFKWLFSFGKREAKLILFFITISLFCVLPLISFVILYYRVPNPDFIIEMIFFAVVSIGFLSPFFIMRFFSIMGLVLDSEPIPPLKTIWLRGKGNSLRILISLFLILVLSVLVLSNYLANVRTVEVPFGWHIGLMSEFIYNLIAMVLMAVFASHCIIQKIYLFKGE